MSSTNDCHSFSQAFRNSLTLPSMLITLATRAISATSENTRGINP